MRKTVLMALVALVAAVVVAYAAESAAPAAHPPMVANPGAVQWGPAPPVLPAGAKLAVLAGDPGAAGVYTIRLSMPDGYRIAPHTHPTDENVTVVSGTFHVAMGKTFDAKSGDALATGGFVSLPANMAHYAWTEGATVVQVHGQGPFTLTYVNPADDPSKPAAKP